MPTSRTEITEIVTGLATMGFPDVARAIEVRPRTMLHVETRHFDTLAAALEAGAYAHEFEVAWDNGIAFARAGDGLRGRPPWSVEWKGNHKPPGYEQIPADLRIDHVFLISCKYGSKILNNSSPGNLFVGLLADREYESAEGWYRTVAPDAYQSFYAACRRHLGSSRLPDAVTDLEEHHLTELRDSLPKRLGGTLGKAYAEFSHIVAMRTAQRWRNNLTTRQRREAMLWRLLRLESAPYFVLGESGEGQPIRYRVATPWDFRLLFAFIDLTVVPDVAAQQPVVRWTAVVRDRESHGHAEVRGHVEVRWSHGRFGRSPEAKVYLDTPHHEVPGYIPLDAGPPRATPPMRLFEA
jgi:hypothetical protein